MIWLVLGVMLAIVVGVLGYWQLIIAEGTYFGPRFVAWTYDLVASRYDGIKKFVATDESWFLAGPLLGSMRGVERPVVLDVATGTGRMPLALLRERFQGRIVGLDLSRGMLHQARAKLRPYGSQVGLIWHGAGHLPFGDGVFDAVTCLESLEFMPRPLEVLSEMVRVLAPGGMLMVTNRVGYEAQLLPGRALSRPAFRRALDELPLFGIDVRRWQVQYDLAWAHKEGEPLTFGGAHEPETDKRRGVDLAGLAALMRCPACDRVLQTGISRLVCAGCERVYPIREGIVLLADPEQQTVP